MENSGRLYSMRRRVQIDTFARNWASNFQKIRENHPGHPKAPPGSSRDPPGIPQGPPRDPQGTPEGPPRDPRGTPKGFPRDPRGTPEGPPRDPMGSPRGPSAAKRKPTGHRNRQRHPKASPRATKTSQGDKLYIKKLPINRLRGRYVIII